MIDQLISPVLWLVTVVRTVTTGGRCGSCLHRLLSVNDGPNPDDARSIQFAVIATTLVLGSVGCATKKYVRNRINERVTPLEQRAGELEETSRRNTQDIGRLGADITEVRGRADRAQAQADAALVRADDANKRAGAAEQSITDLRANLDKYALQHTATVNFKFDSYELTPEAKVSLDQLAAQIRDRNELYPRSDGFCRLGGLRRLQQPAHRKAGRRGSQVSCRASQCPVV